MKKTTFSTIELKPRKGAKGISTGANSVVYLDGKRLTGCRRISIDVEAGGVAKVNLEVYAKVVGKVNSKLKKPTLSKWIKLLDVVSEP